MRTTNPAFKQASKYEATGYEYAKATYTGIGLKILYFLGITLVGAFLGIFSYVYAPSIYLIMIIASLFSSFIFAFIALRSVNLSMPFGTLYCLGEGVFLGVISMLMETIFPGIVLSVVAATFAIVFLCAMMLITGLIRVNGKFLRFLIVASISFVLVTLVFVILSLFGLLQANVWLYIGISAVSILIACLYLLSDMQRVYEIVNSNGAKQLEWMLAFGIAYTMLWIYIELLRIVFLILSIVRRN